MTYRSTCCVLFPVLASTICATPAHAQVAPLPAPTPLPGPTPASAGEAQDGLEDIVVTAQRREESLQSVPIAITALSAQTLSKSGITDLSNLQTRTPGLVMKLSRSSTQPYIRGIGSSVGNPGDAPTVATYVDGVYIQSAAAGIFSFPNVQRIEVLKGPQGTLFGRNATGGLIHIITPDPSFDFKGSASLSYGNYDTVTGSFYATGGLTSTLAADIAAWGTYQSDGFGQNLIIGGDVNRRREYVLRSKLLWTPSAQTRVVLAIDRTENSNDFGHIRQVAPARNTISSQLSATGDNLLFGRYRPAGTLYDNTAGFLPNANVTQTGVSLRISQELGAVSLLSTTAWRNLRSRARFDQDGTPANVIDAVATDGTTTLQQEIVLNGSSDRLKWTAGVFIFDADAKTLPTTVRSSIVLSQNLDRYAYQRTRSYAGFLQGTYSITDSTRFTLGGRFTRDEISGGGYNVSAGNGNPNGPVGTVYLPAAQRVTYNRPTWRIALDQDLGKDILAYASYSRGYKAGGYNTDSYQLPAVRPEVLDAYEIGLKSDLFDRQVRFNVAAFHYDYKNIQLVQSIAGSAIFVNAAASRINGVDIDTTFAPRLGDGQDLSLSASLSLLDGKYSSYRNAPCYASNPAGGLILLTTPCDATGNKTINSPPYTLSLSGDYSVDTKAGELGFNITYINTGKFFFEANNSLFQPSYDILNAQIRFTLPGDKVTFRLWGRNLTYSKYYIGSSQSTLGNVLVPGTPRTYGVEIGFKW